MSKMFQVYGIGQALIPVLPPPLPFANPPTVHQTNYEIGQVVYTPPNLAKAFYIYAGAGNWVELATSSGNVLSVTGTTNQILASPTSGNVVLSLIGPYSASTYAAHSVLIGEGTGAIGTAGPGVAGQVLTSNGVSLDPTFQTPAGGTTSDYADFFALMPGDNAATIAVGAPILLPQNGPSSGTSITRLTSSTFNLADIATYSVSFQCSFDEAGQWMLNLNGSELAPTVSGRATGTNQAYITCLITTTVINSVLSVVNPSGNSTALTITPIAGGTHAVSAHLVIQRIAGGPGGGLLNTINSVVPVSGNINITAGNGVVVTTGAGSVTVEVASGGFTPVPVSGTSQAMLSEQMYIANSASLTTFTLPITSAVGDVIKILGSALNSGGWKVTYTTGQIIWGPAGSSTITTGNAASAAAAAQAVTLTCVVANTTWVITGNSGTITLT